MKERNEANNQDIALNAELKAIREFMTQQPSQAEKQQDVQKPSRDFDKELSEVKRQFQDGDLTQIEFMDARDAIRLAQQQEETDRIRQESQKAVESMLQKRRDEEIQQRFVSDNPKYVELVKQGILEEIIKGDPYGFHNYYSAYFARQLEEARAELKSAVEKAEKETEARVLKNLKAKKESLTLGTGPGSSPSEAKELPPELKNPKKFGGITNVLAQRLAAKRQQAN